MNERLQHLDLNAVQPSIAVWAKKYPDIHAVIVFGSRANGTHRPDSDLDLCIMVDPWAGETWYTRWFFQADQWKQEVLSILNIPSDKLQFCTLTSQQVKEGLQKGCVFLYLREDNPNMPAEAF